MSTLHLPLAPLLQRLGHPNHSAASRLLGVTRRTIVRWSQSGIPPWHADRLAVHVGLHPESLWPGWAHLEVEYRRWHGTRTHPRSS